MWSLVKKIFPEKTEHRIAFGAMTVRSDVLRLFCGMVLLIVFLIIYFLRPVIPNAYYAPSFFKNHDVFSVGTTIELVDHLKENNLWEREALDEVQPVVLNSFPANFSEVDNDTKKKIFLHALLPAALVALDEVENERAALESILGKIQNCPSELRFDHGNLGWQSSLSHTERFYLHHLIKKYRTPEVSKLLLRVNTVPVSLLLAQGAVESSWGASRFVLEGNNLFGIWTWGEDGIIPHRRDEGKTHRVASYESLLDSVRAYLFTLNSASAYKNLRRIREYSMDPLELAEGLIDYSERREDYVADITSIIRTNDLLTYDKCILLH